MNGAGATAEARAMHAGVLDTYDLNWRTTEANRKFTIVADNCLNMYLSDPCDPSPMAHTATEDFWFRNSSFLNVETRGIAKNEFPSTDGCKWLHEDHKFMNTGSLEDMILQDNDHISPG